LLAACQPGAVSNAELNRAVCFRYSARIFELRRAGFEIDTIIDEGGLRQYKLHTPKRLIDWNTLTVKPDQQELELG